MKLRLSIFLPWVILALTSASKLSGAEVFEYNLPALVGDYIGLPWDPDLKGRTAYVLYQGPSAKLVRVETVLTGYGKGALCNDPWSGGTYAEPVFVLLFIGRPEQSYFLEQELFALYYPPHNFEHTDSFYPPHWSGVQTLSPGDSLKVRLYIDPQGCFPPDYSAHPLMTLYDFVLLLEVEELVPIQQRTWGTIKKLFETLP